MDREYIIAGFRIRLEQADRLFVRPGSHMARAFNRSPQKRTRPRP